METIQEKPEVKLLGENGNIFNLLSVVRRTFRNLQMKRNPEEEPDYNDIWTELQTKVFKAGSYEEALTIIEEYCEVV